MAPKKLVALNGVPNGVALPQLPLPTFCATRLWTPILLLPCFPEMQLSRSQIVVAKLGCGRLPLQDGGDPLRHEASSFSSKVPGHCMSLPS